MLAVVAQLRQRLEQALAGRFVIERELGRGGMSVVFLARDLKLGRLVALKVLKEELSAALGPERFHREDVVHRDIKPENILFEAGYAIVSDFGVARAISAAGGDRVTAFGIAVGTPDYMSPEQAGGEEQVDGRSDVYGLG